MPKESMNSSMANFKHQFGLTNNFDQDVIERLFQNHKRTVEKIEKTKYVHFLKEMENV